jgi:hypothetical protein
MSPQRSIMWPIFAVAMVAIAGGALFLVWKQMQDQKPPVINLTQSSGSSEPQVVKQQAGSATSSGSAGDTTVVAQSGSDTDSPGKGPGSAKPRTQDGPRPQVRPSPRYTTYNETLQAQKDALTNCFRDHQEGGIPKDEVLATIMILASGHAKHVQLKPDTMNGAPLGGCLRNVLLAAPYPSGPADQTITVPLKPRSG